MRLDVPAAILGFVNQSCQLGFVMSGYWASRIGVDLKIVIRKVVVFSLTSPF